MIEPKVTIASKSILFFIIWFTVPGISNAPGTLYIVIFSELPILLYDSNAPFKR